MVSKLITTGTANLGNRRYNVVVRHDKREATEVILVVDQNYTLHIRRIKMVNTPMVIIKPRSYFLM